MYQVEFTFKLNLQYQYQYAISLIDKKSYVILCRIKQYCITKKSWPFLYSDLLYKLGQDFLNIKYTLTMWYLLYNTEQCNIYCKTPHSFAVHFWWFFTVLITIQSFYLTFRECMLLGLCQSLGETGFCDIFRGFLKFRFADFLVQTFEIFYYEPTLLRFR